MDPHGERDIMNIKNAVALILVLCGIFIASFSAAHIAIAAEANPLWGAGLVVGIWVAISPLVAEP